MIHLNSNYDQIFQQANKTAQKFSPSLSEEEIFVYMKNYTALCLFYYLNKGQNIFQEDIYENAYYNKVTDNIQNKIDQKKSQNFLLEKENIRKAFVNAFTESMLILANFFEKPLYKKLANKNFQVLTKKDEDIDILLSFFATTDSKMLNLFSELQKEKRFFKYFDHNFIKSDGITLFNYTEGISNVFIRKKPLTIETLDTYVHELGHVWDFANLRENTPFIVSSMYSALSDYNEVISTKNDIRFFKYLIDNNIHKDQALISFSNLIYNYALNFYNIILLSLLDNKKYLYVLENSISEKDLENYFKSKYQAFPTSYKNNSREINLDENLSYSLGLLLGCYFNEHEDSLEKFLQERSMISSFADIEKFGIPLEEPGKCLIKTINQYFN